MTQTGGRVLVLNGGSSSGKTTLARRLQEVLDGTWLRLGVDTLVDAAPPRLLTDDGLVLAADGSVVAGPAFVAAERQWMAGVAAMAAAGAAVLVEDAFVSGPAGRRRWAEALAGVPVTWVGVRCSAEVAAAREVARGDRTTGMAARQAEPVHTGISYDLEVDTGVLTTDAAADVVRAHLDATPAAPAARPRAPGDEPLTALRDRALTVRRLYAELERRSHGRSWTREELLLGFVTDVGDLARIALAREGVRDIGQDPAAALAHELADCLWCVLVLADAWDVDLPAAFNDTMEDLAVSIRARLDGDGPAAPHR